MFSPLCGQSTGQTDISLCVKPVHAAVTLAYWFVWHWFCHVLTLINRDMCFYLKSCLFKSLSEEIIIATSEKVEKKDH